MPRLVPAPNPRIALRMASTIPRRIPSMIRPAKRRQKPARGPEAPPLYEGALCGGGGYIVTTVLLSDQGEATQLEEPER
jgi:hypothetical protein